MWPEILTKCELLLWFLNIVWLTHMLISSQTTRAEETSQNPIRVAIAYLKSDFILDFVATIPTIFLSNYHNVYLLRVFHFHELSKSIYPLYAVIGKLIPNSRIGRLNFTSIVQFGYCIFLGVHYIVCLWIWIGTR